MIENMEHFLDRIITEEGVPKKKNETVNKIS